MPPRISRHGNLDYRAEINLLSNLTDARPLKTSEVSMESLKRSDRGLGIQAHPIFSPVCRKSRIAAWRSLHVLWTKHAPGKLWKLASVLILAIVFYATGCPDVPEQGHFVSAQAFMGALKQVRLILGHSKPRRPPWLE